MKKIDNQRVSCAAIIGNDKKEILLLQRSPHEKFLVGEWEFPGGKSDIGEDPLASIKREVKEECGLDIQPIAPISISTFLFSEEGITTQWIEINFFCKQMDKRQQIVLSDEHNSYQWFLLQDNNIRLLRPFIRDTLLSFQDSAFYTTL